MTQLHPLDCCSDEGHRWDLIVIGAGPAGSGATISALHPDAGERKVLLLDAKAFPRRKACGGCLNPRSIGLLKNLVGPHHPLWDNSIQLSEYQIFHRQRSFTYPVESGCAVDRAVMDAALVKQAQRAGATFIDKATARLGPIDGEFRIVHVTAGQRQFALRAKCVVIASGLGNRTAGDFPDLHQSPSKNSRVGVEAVFDANRSGYQRGRLAMVVGTQGYVGLTEIQGVRLHVAASVDRKFLQTYGPEKAVAQLLQQAGAPQLSQTGARWKGTPPLTARAIRLADRRVFLVGDAAGYVEPFTGEGIRWALESAQGVTPMVDAAVAGWTDDLIEQWEHWYARSITNQQKLCRQLSSGLKRPALRWVAHQALRFSPPLAAKIIQKINS